MACPGRYGADATSGRVGHPVALSHRPAEIAGVVEALMRHDELLGGSAEAGGDGPRTSRPRATRRMRPRARRRSGSLPRPCARRLARYEECTPRPRPALESLEQEGDGAPCRGLPWRASGETETAPPAEAYPREPRARRSLFRDLLLEARGEVGSVVAGKGPTVLSSSFILMFAWGTPF